MTEAQAAEKRRGPWPLPVIPERRRHMVAIHAHRHPRWPVMALAGLVMLLSLAVLVLAVYVGRFSDYVEGRGDYRDAETQRIEQSIDRAVCDILSEFPTGDERADRLRLRYGCTITTPEGTP